MLHTIIDIATETWLVAGDMAPYLLLGFLLAGVLSVLVSPEMVERHLGGRGLWQVVKAALIGVPLPLCSCSVLPLSVSLRRHGASKGATVSFLASTPQTGVDSIMVTYGLLGPVFAVARVVVAFASGILGGLTMDIVDRSSDPPSECESECCRDSAKRKPAVVRVFRHGFVTLPGEIGRAMLAGLLLAGIISAVVPGDFFAHVVPPGVLQMLLMMVVGMPMYVCSSGSVPIALALIKMGISPGAALVFLVTGPATNAAAITTILKFLGRQATFVYLGCIAVCAMIAGFVMDRLPILGIGGADVMTHCDGRGLHGSIMAGVLLALLLPSLRRRGGGPAALRAAAESLDEAGCHETPKFQPPAA